MLKLLSFNVHKGIGWHRFKSTFKTIEEQIRVLSPDIIFFQEIVGKQVESILGPPTTVDTKDVQLKRTVYIYAQGKESVTVVFKDDKVQSTTSTLSE